MNIKSISFGVLAYTCMVFGQATHAQFKTIATIAGNGLAGDAVEKGRALEVSVSNPFGVQPEADGSLIIASYDQHVIYRLDASYGRLELIAGTGKVGMSGRDGDFATKVAFNQPHEVQVDAAGNIYIADTMNHRVGMIDGKTHRWKNIAGTGQKGFSGDRGLAVQATLDQAYSIAVDGNLLFVADLGNHRIRRIDLQSGKINTICGTGTKAPPTEGGVAVEQSLAGPRSLAVDAQNIWIVLREGNSVWRIDRSSDCIFHVAGTGEKGFSGDGGDAKLAKLNGPKGIAVEPGVAIYVADTENHAVRRVDLKTGAISTTVGSSQGMPGFNGDGDDVTRRLLRRPHGVCVLSSGELLIGDSENHRVRVLRN